MASVGLTSRDHHVGGVGAPGVEDRDHERDRGHDPAYEVGRAFRYQQGADHREGTEPYIKDHALHVLDQVCLVPQPGGTSEQVERAVTRDVQGDDQPSRHACKSEEQCATTHPTTLIACLFRHDTTLHHYRLPSVTKPGDERTLWNTPSKQSGE